MFANRREHVRIRDPELLAGQLGAERGVQHDWVIALERTDRKASPSALREQPLGREEPRQIVEQARGARRARIDAVRAR